MKKYIVYMDDSRDCFKVAVPAKNEDEAREYVEGNGEVIAIKDITDKFPIEIGRVMDALQKAHFRKIEIDLITRCLLFNDIAE